MPIETNLNQSPFYDDYDEAKNFHRVLFRPGYAVQARELTQLQTILQNQIERGFNEILKDGTVITGVQVNADEVGYVKVRDKDANNRSIITSDFYTLGALTNTIAVGTTTGIQAKIIDISDGSEAAASTGGNFTLFVNYMNSGTDNATKTFADNEVITVRNHATNAFVVAANTIVTSATGKGFRALVGDGIVYNKGHFVRVPSQFHIVEKYNTTPSKLLGFEVAESTVDSNEDASTLDNATGATNFAAPGAERLKLLPTLTSRVRTTANTGTFFPIADIQEGIIIKDQKETQLAELGKYIADRLYETSGDYVTKPFNMRIREHLKGTDNLGRYNAGSTPAGSADKLVVEVEAGVGYVQGYRLETIASQYLSVDKALTYDTKDAATISQSFGNYVIVDETVGPFDFRALRTVSLRSAAANAITSRTWGSTSAPGSEIGTAKVRGFEYHSGTAGTSAGQYRVYLFDIKMNSTKSFSADVKSLYYNGPTADALADCVLESSKAVLKETNINNLLFSFSQSGIKTLKDAANAVDTQWVTRKSSVITFNADDNKQGTVTIANTATGGTENFSDSVESATDRKKFIVQTVSNVDTINLTGTVSSSGVTVTGSGTAFTTQLQVGDVIVSDSQVRIVATITSTTVLTTDAAFSGALSSDTFVKRYPIGHIFDFSGDSGDSSNSGSSKVLDIGGPNIAANWTGKVYYNVTRSSAVAASKTINKNKYVHLNLGSHNVAARTGPWSLGVPDAMKIRKVWKGSNTGVTFGTGTDVTSHFLLDTGATDSFYGTSKLRKKTTSSLSLAVGDGLLVEFDYFTVDVSSGRGFFSVDSYPIDDVLSSNTAAIMTKDIPIHTSPSSGSQVDLRNAVDFRPRLTATATPNANTAGVDAPTNPAVLTIIAEDNVAGSYVPTPDENFQADVQYYLPRRDNIILTSQGDVAIIAGEPSLTPRTPPDTNEAMTLATLKIPVYPSLSPHVSKQTGRTDYEASVGVKNNRRFTMRDLRGVARRVKNLEYYASLNSLEASSKDKQIFNSAGTARFKNGFFVDNFDGHNNAAKDIEGYRASIDINKSQLRPVFKRKDVSLRKSTTQTGSNVTQTGNIITLSYTHETFIRQDKATKLRNPAQEISFVWNGKITLDPEIDNTPDVTQLPDIQIDFSGMYDSIASIVDIIGGDDGVLWGDWENSGPEYDVSTGIGPVYHEEVTENWDEWGDNLGARVQDETITPQQDQLRQGQELSISPSVESFELGNQITNVAVRDYMRSRLVQFTGYSLRPETRLYAYFDDELVSSYVTPTNASFANTNIEGAALTTDATGTVYGNFRIPNDDVLRFRAGERKFQLVDIANTQTESTLVTTEGSAIYMSTPLELTQHGTSVNVTTPQVSSSDANPRERTIDAGPSRINTVAAPPPPVDPLAQTFLVQTNDTSEGIFATKVDLFFGKKSPTFGVTVELREMGNGIPTPNIVPFAQKTLQASAVNVSTTVATNATTFTFDSPVYLRNGEEYALIVRPGGNCADYALWCAELGATDVDTLEGVYKVPAGGVMMTSSNDRTWTTHQKEDLKFNLYRAKFSTSTGTVYMENEDLDMFSIDSISGPGFNVGEKVTAESVLVFANTNTTTFAVGDIIQNRDAKIATANTQLYANGVIRQIVSTAANNIIVKLDSYGSFANTTALQGVLYRGATHVGNTKTWSANTSSGIVDHYDQGGLKLRLTSSTGSFANGYVRGQKSGHTAHIVTTAPDNAIISMTVPKVPVMNYKDTTSAWGLRQTSSSGVISSSYLNINLGKENYFRDAEKKMYSKTNETTLNTVDGNKKSYVVKGTLSTTNDKTSPVIHIGKSTAILIENVINNVSTEEDKEVGGALMRYITKPVVLGKDNDAEDLKVYVTAYKPVGTDIAVYAKVLNNEDGEPFKDKSYSLLTKVTTDSVISDSINVNDHKEYEYGFSANTDGQNFLATAGANTFARLNSSDSNIVAYEDSSGGVYKGFKTFSIKIVMTSTGTNVVPTVKNMRAIALQI